MQSIQDKLENTGREQFFYHCPESEMPIREIAGSRKSKTGKASNRGKTEPHIEIGAENYLRSCIQSNIKVFCRSSERYLFLCTKCKNREVRNGTFLGKRFIIGYIEKEGCIHMGDHLAVIGSTYIVPFDRNLEYQSLGFKRSRGMQKFNETDTQRLLKLIHRHKNIRTDCVWEMIKQEEKARAEGRYIPVDNECLEDECEFRNSCLRRKLQ